MPSDPTLESLMAVGHYAIAADRYEEETGDAELAALMRLDGLEWELVDDVPELKLTTELTDFEGRFMWWNVRCGTIDLGTVGYEPLDDVPLPGSLTSTPILSLLFQSGLHSGYLIRFRELYLAAVTRSCR